MDKTKYNANLSRDDLHRLQSLTDGVFAIAMTILILGMHIPTNNGHHLGMVLLHMWPQYLTYAISFALLGMYWLGHKGQLYYVIRTNHTYEWINILFLGLVVFIPFVTQLLQQNPFNKLALTLYALNLSGLGLVLYGMWCYAIYEARLVGTDITPHIIRIGQLRTLFAPGCYLLSLLFMFISPMITLIIFAVIPLLYIIPVIQKFWGRV